jgi:precorrin-2 dehydrogenase / sirohydrochlorin ferrochelatase
MNAHEPGRVWTSPRVSAQALAQGAHASMSLFPMFLKLEGRLCLVVGAAGIAESKISSLLAAHASVGVVAAQASETVMDWARQKMITWYRREFRPSDLNGVFMVIAATSSGEVNAKIFREAQQQKVLCNAVDDPEHCDFYYPAVVRRGDLQIAISTAGRSPALAQRLRCELETQFGPEYADWLTELGSIRENVFEIEKDPEKRRRLLHEMASRKAFQQREIQVHKGEVQ